MKKLAIIITHPIQYYVPVFQLLAKKCELKVFYTWGDEVLMEKFDPGFGKAIKWDVPLLDGYEYEFLKNTAKEKGSHHGKGIINPDILSKIDQFDPNAVLVYGYTYHSHLKAMKYFKGKIPIWFRGDSTLLDENNKWKSLAKKIYLKWAYGYVDKAFHVGTNNKSYFKKYGLKEEQLCFAPHATDNERFAEDRLNESSLLRTSLGIAKEDVLILFAGKLESKKNPNLLLEAFIELNKEREIRKKEKGKRSKDYRNVHLLFVGSGVLEKELKQKAKRYFDKLSMTLIDAAEKLEFIEIGNRKSSIVNPIHFLDFQNQTQMPVVYQACDIFCLPSKGPGETWGLSINEAMAAGKAIIASDKVGCAIDLVKSGKNGFIYDSSSATALTDVLRKLISANKFSSYGQMSSKIIGDWTFDKQVDAILDELAKTN